jgi:ribonuclease D
MSAAEIATDADVADLCDALLGSPWVAVDTEFHSESRYIPDLYLLQVALPDGRCVLVDALRPDHLARLAEPLCAVDWVVHGGAQDLVILRRALGGLPSRVFDTQIVAGLLGPAFPAPFGQLVESWLGRTVEKASTLSDWSARPLSSKQVAYARADVVLLVALWTRLEAELVARGRRDVAIAACDEARSRAFGVDHRELWRSMAAAATLAPRSVAALQELLAWREAVAEEEGAPPRRVLGDALLLDVARRRPVELGALLDDRRFPKGLVRKRGTEIIGAVAAANRRADAQLPASVPKHSPLSHRAALYELVARVTGDREGFAADLVLPRLVAEDLALAGGDLGAVSPWRRVLVGAALEAVESGRLVLSLEPNGVCLIPR